MLDTSTLPDIQYRANPGLLTVRWFAELSPELMPQHYEAVLTAGLAHGTSRWLLDMRRRANAAPAGISWLVTNWLPQARTAVAPHPLRLAYLILPHRAESLLHDPMLQAARHQIRDSIEGVAIRAFCDEGDALRWLTAQA